MGANQYAAWMATSRGLTAIVWASIVWARRADGN